MGFRTESLHRSKPFLRPRILVPVLLLIAILGLWLSRVQDHFNTVKLRFDETSKLTQKVFPSSPDFSDIYNSTLGFEKLFFLNLPSRTDKRDAFELTSSVVDMDVGIVEGVDGAVVPDKALTFKTNFKDEASRNRAIGSWRAHTEFIRKVVKEKLSSAMLFEDDQDWDVNIKSQFAHFAEGTRFLSSNSSSSKPPQSPYGDDWDLLWPGHCGSNPVPDTPRFVIDNDPTVPAPKHRMNFVGKPDMSPYTNSSRIVYRLHEGCCTWAYALSYRGAQKLFHRQAFRSQWDAFDISLSDFCRDPDFKCLSLFPQLTTCHFAAGPVSHDSDLAQVKDTSFRVKAATPNIVTSARLNILNIVNGREPVLQNPQDQPKLEGPVSTWVDNAPHPKKEPNKGEPKKEEKKEEPRKEEPKNEDWTNDSDKKEESKKQSQKRAVEMYW